MSFLTIASAPMRAFIDRHALMIMIVCAVFMGLYLQLLSVLDHQGLRTEYNDLGIIEQAVWQIARGNFSMPVSNYAIHESWFASHTNVILYALAPLYMLFESPLFFLLLTGPCIAIASVLLFFCARKILQRNITALLFGLAFLASPAIQETSLFDFHVEVLALPLLIGVLLALESKRWRWYWACLVLLLFVKEDMPLLVLALTPLAWVRGSKKIALWTLLIALFYWIGINAFNRLFLDTSVASHAFFRFQYLGETPMDAMQNFLLHPLKTTVAMFDALFQTSRLKYLVYVLLQGGFLAIASPLALLPALPNIAQNFLDSTGFQSRISGVYYSGIPVTMLFVASAYGLSILRKNRPRLAQIGTDFFALQAVAMALFLSPTPYGIGLQWIDFFPVHSVENFKEMLMQIPADAKVATQNNVGAHMAGRDVIVKIPSFYDDVEYVALAIFVPHAREKPLFLQNDSMMIGMKPTEYALHTRALFDDSRFGIVWYKSPFYLFKKDHPQALNPDAQSAAEEDLERLRFDEEGWNARL